jgi:hypothetical protein
MAHLIAPLKGPCALQVAYQDLIHAHDVLVASARQAAQSLAGLDSIGWGAAAKRHRVAWRHTNASLLSAVVNQPLIEVINQCATVERLLDAMGWVLSVAPSAELVTAHPTTSRGAADSIDNDLVVRVGGEPWCFEVSDVVNGAVDGNGKELKDLYGLGLIVRDGAKWQLAEPLPPGSQFLTVSPEFATRLCRPNRHLLKTDKLRYTRIDTPGNTALIEVHPNP